MQKQSKIFVTGGDTLIGAAIVRQLKRQGYRRVWGGPENEPSLVDARAVNAFFERVKPEYVFHAGGKSGGIAANNKYPADLIYDNIAANTNVIHAAHTHRATKLLYLASSCTYPKQCPQPMRPESLMSGPLEPTNEAYAVAKLAGIALCQAYRRQHGDDMIIGIPANAFGIGDDFSLEDSHVIGGLMRRMYDAKQGGDGSVKVWGTGSPRREFIFADDLADACLFVMEHYSNLSPINLGLGTTVSIRELAEIILGLVNYEGIIEFDSTHPDGILEKSTDSSVLRHLGWTPKVTFHEALNLTYQSFLRQASNCEAATIHNAFTVKLA